VTGPYRSLTEERIHDLEDAERSFRIRFAFVLVAVVLLTAGLGASFVIQTNRIDSQRDDTHRLCQAIKELSDERRPCR
jgi:hypothetical protein